MGIAQLTDQEITDACKELENLYHYTQNRLATTGKVVDGKVELVRSLREFEKKQ